MFAFTGITYVVLCIYRYEGGKEERLREGKGSRESQRRPKAEPAKASNRPKAERASTRGRREEICNIDTLLRNAGLARRTLTYRGECSHFGALSTTTR